MHRIRRFMNQQQGYTLVVVAAIFAAFAVSMAAYLDRNVVTQQMDRQRAAREQISRIASAIALYKFEHGGRYPCPAAANVVPTHPNFGVAFTYTSAGCDTKPTDPVGNVTAAALVTLSGSTEVIRGMVPVRTLSSYGLDINDAFDPWNGRIMYVVNKNLTLSASGTATTRPTVTQTTLGLTLLPPDYILVSYGRDRRGAYLRSQTATGSPADIASPAIACTGTELRSENCNSDLTFKIAGTFTPSNAATTAYFDDIVSPFVDGPGTDGGGGGGGCAPTECYVTGWVDNGPCGGCAIDGQQWQDIGIGCRKYRCNSGTITDIGAGTLCKEFATCI